MVEQSIVVPSRKESLTVILDNKNMEIEKNYFSRDLTPEMRLLHHIANKIFFLKIGRLDFVGQRDLCIMYYIIMEKPTNLSGMIMSHMMDQLKKKLGSLPNEMLLTELFEDAATDGSNEVSQILLHYDTYNKNCLRRMKYVKIKDQWICRESKSGASSFTKEERKETWTHSDAPNIPV